jgi:hypothetical protein
MANNFQPDHAALRAVLRSPGVMAELRRRGDAIAARGGPDIGVEEWVGRNRDRVHVYTATPRAMVREARDHTLLAALDAGRG